MRFIVLLMLLLGIFITPWWVATVMMLISVMLYRDFFWALIPAVLLDVLHGGARLGSEPWLSATLIIAAALLILSFLEGYIRDNVRI